MLGPFQQHFAGLIGHATEVLDGVFDRLGSSGFSIAKSTQASVGHANTTLMNTTTLAHSTALGATSEASSVPVAGQSAGLLGEFLSLRSFRGMFNMFGYIISKWSIMTVLVAVVINRTQFFASSRRPLEMRWYTRLVMYALPILSLTWQSVDLLRAIRCQTSPQWTEHRYHKAERIFSLDFAGNGGPLYNLASLLLSFESEVQSCSAIKMGGLPEGSRLAGSLSLLWPTFITLCIAQVTEGFTSTLQGRQPTAEVSLFEHSLAFAEAEAHTVRPFEVAFTGGKLPADLEDEVPNVKFSRNTVLRVMNTTPEILLVAFISCAGSLLSNILAVFGLRRRLRLVTTAILGSAYLAVFFWTIWKVFASDDEIAAESLLLRFPTVFIVGYIPHILLLFGTVICACVYALAFTVTLLSPPTGSIQPSNFQERVFLAAQNLQAHIFLATGPSLNFSWEDDFFAAVLKAGFAFVTAASDAVYLKEGQAIQAASGIWLERKRLEDMLKPGSQLVKLTYRSIPRELRNDDREASSADVQLSGYAVERKPFNHVSVDSRNAVPTFEDPQNTTLDRAGRVAGLGRLLQSAVCLLIALQVRLFLIILQKFGISPQPNWLRRHTAPKNQISTSKKVPKESSATEEGKSRQRLRESSTFPSDLSIDVEAELVRRLGLDDPAKLRRNQHIVDDALYDWWLQGGWWGEVDTSGEYIGEPSSESMTEVSETSQPRPELEQDIAIEASARMEQDDSDPVEDDFDLEYLSTLLNPRSPEDREAAKMLAQRLERNTVLTRSQYARAKLRESLALFGPFNRGGPIRQEGLTQEDEEKLLEDLMVQLRNRTTNVNDAQPGFLDQQACVLCQDSPRTVLLWPCGHLALCDECRVSLASRNFSRCICCRTRTTAFSRFFRP